MWAVCWSHRCTCVYAKGWGREIVLDSFIVPGEVSVNSASLGHAPTWVNNISIVCPGALQIGASMLYICGLFSLLSLQEQLQCPWALSYPILLSLRTGDFKPHLKFGSLQELPNLSPLIFQANCYGKSSSLCAFLCASLCITLFLDHNSHSSAVIKVCFFAKPGIWTFNYIQYGLLCTVSCGVCFSSIQVDVWGI